MIDIVPLYEDNHILVVNKPAGLLTQPSGTDQLSLEFLCKEYLRKNAIPPKEGRVFLHSMHRLDKSVEGIILFAKTSKALKRLNVSSRNKEAKKIYRALLERAPREKDATLENYLVHDHFKANVVSENDPQSKFAKLHYQIIEESIERILVEIQLETGRYHQIRAQFGHINCPIVGDIKYGAQSPLKGGAIALKHTSLSIRHPITQEMMVFVSEFLF